MLDGHFVGLVLILADTKVVCFDQLDKVLAFDGTSGELQLVAADLVEVLSKHGDYLADFSIGGIVGQYDAVVPNEMALMDFHFLRSGDDMGVLRLAAKGLHDEQGYEKECQGNVFHGGRFFGKK